MNHDTNRHVGILCTVNHWICCSIVGIIFQYLPQVKEVTMSLFTDVSPNQSGSKQPSRTTKGGAGFDSPFFKIPVSLMGLFGKGIFGFIMVLAGASKNSNRTYRKPGRSWRKWPW